MELTVCNLPITGLQTWVNPLELNWAQHLLIFTPLTFAQVLWRQSTTGIKDMVFGLCMWSSPHCPWAETKPSSREKLHVLPYTHLCYLASSGRTMVCVCWSLCFRQAAKSGKHHSKHIFKLYICDSWKSGVSVRREGKWAWPLRLEVRYLPLLLDHYRWDNKLHSILS